MSKSSKEMIELLQICMRRGNFERLEHGGLHVTRSLDAGDLAGRLADKQLHATRLLDAGDLAGRLADGQLLKRSSSIEVTHSAHCHSARRVFSSMSLVSAPLNDLTTSVRFGTF
mmetsp:Transcript_28615/g.73699  ORF Transcript_28615/g.73699 Transcript_28615/m.73699 type:complete len:114 (+) Transcript_28615:1227-1568(+)